jgi:methionine-rich copper-binding protein CopC
MRGLPWAAAVLLAVTVASAHSLLVESSPAAGAVVRTSPGRLTLRFSNRIEQALSRVRVLDGRNQPVTLEAVPGPGEPDRLAVRLPPLPAGRYRVEWQVLSADGHLVSGAFRFQVAP